MKHAIELLNRHKEVYELNLKSVPGILKSGSDPQVLKKQIREINKALKVLQQNEAVVKRGTIDSL